MKISAAITSLFLASIPAGVVHAAAGFYQYDPTLEYNPESWAAVEVDGNQCGGTAQSPIDIPARECGIYDDYVYSRGTCTLANMKFKINANGIQADYNADECEPPRMYIPGKDFPFDALQFHIHAGSEHAMQGRYFGLEAHLVHKEVGHDSYAVLGIFIEPDSNAIEGEWGYLLDMFNGVAKNVSAACGNTVSKATDQSVNTTGSHSFDYYSVVPVDASIYTYSGSLTTPPCSEVVAWNVVDKIVKVTPREWFAISDLILEQTDPVTCMPGTTAAPNGYTSRPVQLINGRDIVKICPTMFA